MSKIFSKTVKKTTLWSVIIAIVLAAAIVVCALFGFNKNIEMQDKKTLTVSLNAYVYKTQLDEIKGDLVDELGSEYTLEGAMSGDVSEIVFVFEKDADLATLATKAQTYLDTKLKGTGAKYSVSASTETATVALAKGYVVRAAIAGVVLAVLAFAYVSLRYKLASGITAGASVLLGMLLTAALVVLTRVYVNASVAYVITLAGLFTAMMTMFTLNNVRAAKAEGASTEEAATSVAVKEVLYTAVVVAVGVLLVGILGKTLGIWFAVSALIAVVASAFVSLFFAPAMYLSVQTMLDSKPAKEGYVGAKKTSTKEKKTYAAKTEEVAPVVEVAEEPVLEETVEEEPTVEETTEEPAEEVEEAPVEEANEEAAEETTEE